MVAPVIPGEALHLRRIAGHLEVLSGGDLPHLGGGVLVAGGQPAAVRRHREREDGPLPAVLVHGAVGARPGVVPADAAIAGGGEAAAVRLPADRRHGAGVATVAGHDRPVGADDRDLPATRSGKEPSVGRPGEADDPPGELDRLDCPARAVPEGDPAVLATGREPPAARTPVEAEHAERVLRKLGHDGAANDVEDHRVAAQRSGSDQVAARRHGEGGDVIGERRTPGRKGRRAAAGPECQRRHLRPGPGRRGSRAGRRSAPRARGSDR